MFRRLNELVENFRSIVSVNRNLGFCTISYNYLIQVIPIFIVAPRYIRAEIEFGVITQSQQAFTAILGAFSLIVTQFTLISSYVAVVNRLGAIWDALDERRRPRPRSSRPPTMRLGSRMRASRSGRRRGTRSSLTISTSKSRSAVGS